MPSETLLENQWNPVKLGNRKGGGYSVSTYEVSSSWYNNQLNNTGDRKIRLQRYHDMDNSTVEISRALDVIAEDVSSCNADDEEVFLLKYPDDAKVLKSTLKMMEDMKEVWQERTEMDALFFERVRKTLKFGATFFYKKPDGSLKELHTEKMAGYILDPEDEDIVTHYVYDESLPRLYDVNKRTDAKAIGHMQKKEDSLQPIPVSDLLVFKIGDGPFGESILERVYSTWKRMDLLRNAVVIYRVVRASERRIYYIDVGNLQGPKREAAIEKQRMRLMQKQATRKGHDITTEFDPHSTTEDIFIPTNSTGKGSRVETLQSGGALGELSDLNYFTRSLAAGMRIPPSMIDTHDEERNTYSDMRVGQVYQIEMRYMGYVRRFAKMFARKLEENFLDFCKRRDVIPHERMWLDISPSQSFALYKQMETQQQMLNIYNSTMQINAMSRKYALQQFMHMEHDDLENNEIDKLKEFGLEEEVINDMPEHHVNNIVYGDGRMLSEYGIEANPQGGGFGGFR